ncbi:MAG: tRNA (N(6)-L-threonylcarbamoyladenosine(37)-C(2))-methylthiotransferase MtaB [Clostridiales bacterium]|nr:tRNA (N(6)-L-threonylcarbamoyladenosine(37)-C(2))-methylthiotransferase MtaB [Clostridiales bacterium]
MKTVAFHTLGCKVNQYDTQAMLELFRAAGYEVVPFEAEADVYVINTCTVTGTGDKKSLQLTRRLRRERPESHIVLAGCLAQRKASELQSTGARLIIGTQHRNQVVSLLERAVAENVCICAVNELNAATPFEEMTITTQDEHTRATLKIQEGCNNHCTYCIIPSVRGPIRSRSISSIREETQRLVDAGYTELVLTGIHLSSYGRDLQDGSTLLDAIGAVHEVEGVQRIRLGSLEPTIATEAFAQALAAMPKVCPQFHLALQSGSNTVLARMGRRYNMTMYMQAVDNLRAAFPMAAFTTDVLTCFPGETEAEYQETRQVIRAVGFAKIHVFPYSPREGTKAAVMPDQLSKAVKERRTRELIALGEETADAYQRQWLGKESTVLLEERIDGCWHGYTPEYIPVTIPDGPACAQGKLVTVRLTAASPEGMTGEII